MKIMSYWHQRFALITAFFAAVAISYNAMPHDWAVVLPDWIKMALAGGTLISGGVTAVLFGAHKKRTKINDDAKQ